MPILENARATGGFEISGIQTHAAAIYEGPTCKIEQWAVITIRAPKGFDFKANGAAVLKKLQAAADLIGELYT